MPPHCDSLDGPVVRAAQLALATGEVARILPYVPAATEDEIVAAFELALAVRTLTPDARILADTAFFETVVRVHRAGEGHRAQAGRAGRRASAAPGRAGRGHRRRPTGV